MLREQPEPEEGEDLVAGEHEAGRADDPGGSGVEPGQPAGSGRRGDRNTAGVREERVGDLEVDCDETKKGC